MKKLFKIFLEIYLLFFSRLAIMIHRPLVIAIAGSTNKSFIKDEINRVLRSRGFDVRSNIKSFNTEIGLPLAILSLPSGYGVFADWVPAVTGAPKAAISGKFPEILVLEYGISSPGDMKKLIRVAKPRIGIISSITQRYLESFEDMDEVVSEFKILANNIDKAGLLIYNSDNSRLSEIAASSRLKKISIGIEKDADFKVLTLKNTGGRQQYKLKYGGKEMGGEILRPGKHHVYAHLAALAVETAISNATAGAKHIKIKSGA